MGILAGLHGDPSEEVRESRQSQGIVRHCPSVGCKSVGFMRVLGYFQAACKQFSVDAGLEAICGQLSGVLWTCQVSGFLGISLRAFRGLVLGGATFKHFLQQLWLFADNRCTFRQSICSDSATEPSGTFRNGLSGAMLMHSSRGSSLKGGYNNSLHVPLAVPTPALNPFFLFSSTRPSPLRPLTSANPGPRIGTHKQMR